MNADEFAGKWLNKFVKYKGTYYNIPIDVTYKVTAALLNYEDNGNTIFAIMSEKWNPPSNVDWFTIKMTDEELKDLDNFEVIG